MSKVGFLASFHALNISCKKKMISDLILRCRWQEIGEKVWNKICLFYLGTSDTISCPDIAWVILRTIWSLSTLFHLDTPIFVTLESRMAIGILASATYGNLGKKGDEIAIQKLKIFWNYFATNSFDTSEIFSMFSSTFPVIFTGPCFYTFPSDTGKICPDFPTGLVIFTSSFDTFPIVTRESLGTIFVWITTDSDVVTLIFPANSPMICLDGAISWPLAGVGAMPFLAKFAFRTVRVFATSWYTFPILATLQKRKTRVPFSFLNICHMDFAMYKQVIKRCTFSKTIHTCDLEILHFLITLTSLQSISASEKKERQKCAPISSSYTKV